MSKKSLKYRVIKDDSEKKGWDFPCSPVCLGTVVQYMETADYTLEGYESVVLVERKGAVSELAGNLVDGAFVRELERMEKIDFPHVICEFTFADLANYPASSGIPKRLWPTLKTSGAFLVKRYWELALAFKARWTFCGKSKGREAASSLFKRIVEHVPCQY